MCCPSPSATRFVPISTRNDSASIFTVGCRSTKSLIGVAAISSIALIAAGIGMMFNIVRFAMSRNKRSFMSSSMVMAKEYEVQVPSNLLAQAKEAAAKPVEGV